VIKLPEIGPKYIRVPVARRLSSDRIRTITISADEGIKALYAGNRKKILTYLFAVDKGWTLEKAKKWVAAHKSQKEVVMKDKLHVKATTEVKGDRILAVASEEVEDRDGEILSIGGWDLRAFKRNPQLLWYHNLKERSLPIGKATKIKIQKIGSTRKLTFEPLFETITEFGRTVKKF